MVIRQVSTDDAVAACRAQRVSRSILIHSPQSTVIVSAWAALLGLAAFSQAYSYTTPPLTPPAGAGPHSLARGAVCPQMRARRPAPAPASVVQARRARQTWVAELQFYQGNELRIDWKKPIASGNFGSVFYGSTPDGRHCVVKCPVLDEFALALFDTERAVNIKLSQQTGKKESTGSLPWATMLGEVTIPEPTPIDSNLARIGIVWEKEGQGVTLEEYLSSGKDLYGVLLCRETPLQAKNLLRPELCRNVLGQMLIALIQVQEKGIVHRDVKPSNALVVPNDPQHQIKIIDFGSSCDLDDPLKRGLGDATCDLMYAPPEQKIQLQNPGKFDAFSVGMIGIRVLFPSLTRGGVTFRWPGGAFQQFAEQMLPSYDWNLRQLIRERANSGKGNFERECKEALEDQQIMELMEVILKLVDKTPGKRINAHEAINRLGPEWAERAKREDAAIKASEAEEQHLRAIIGTETESQVSAPAPLPPGWYMATDEATGNEYYYTAEGQVTWERPQ